MHIDYEISLRDFQHGEFEVYRPRNVGQRKFLFLGLVGLVFIGMFVNNVARYGYTPGQLPILLPALVTLLPYILLQTVLLGSIRKVAKKQYWQTPWLRERLAMDINEEGLQFTGQSVSMKITWSECTKFSEDRRVFIIHQRNPQRFQQPFVFHIVPKRSLSRDQIDGLRRYLQTKIPAKNSSPGKSSSKAVTGSAF
jgi:YcxB-like protein